VGRLFRSYLATLSMGVNPVPRFALCLKCRPNWRLVGPGGRRPARRLNVNLMLSLWKAVSNANLIGA